MAGGIAFKKEFQLKNFGFGYDKPYKFSLPEWKWHKYVFVAWRIFWALWHLGWLIRSLQDQADISDGEKWFIYLTNWSFLMLTIQSVLHLIVVICNICKSRTSADDFHEETATKWYEKMLWFFTSISFDAAFIVTVMYWGFVFEELTKALSIVTHAVTTLYVITDMLISASPTRLLHFIYGALYGLVYGLFTLFYHLGDGTNNEGHNYIYEVLDWYSPGISVGLLVGLVFIATPVVHLFVFGIYTFRVYMSQRCGCGRLYHEDDKEAVIP